MDAHSKWPYVEILQSTTVTKTIDVLRRMFSMFGIPAHVVTDNGPQFTAEEFAVFMAGNGIKHTRSVPYHTLTNGLAERFVQSMKQGLKASLSSGLPLLQFPDDIPEYHSCYYRGFTKRSVFETGAAYSF